MTAVFGILLCLGFIGSGYAKTEDEVKAWFVQLGMDCSQDHHISSNEAMLLAQHKMPNSKEAKCLMACVFKKAKWIGDKGTFLVENGHAFINENNEDEEKAKKAHALFDICKSVNDETVTDGDDGCDRAGHLLVCLSSNLAKERHLENMLKCLSAELGHDPANENCLSLAQLWPILAFIKKQQLIKLDKYR